MNAKLLWICLLYLAEGLPFGIFNETLPVYFRTQGLSLEHIGLLNLCQLPWSFKAFWSPLIDRYGKPQHWMVSMLVVLMLLQLGFANWSPMQLGVWLPVLLFAVSTASATQDIAIDGYFIRAVHHNEEGFFNSMRILCYRAGMIVAGGCAIALTAYFSWSYVLLLFAAIYALFAVCIARLPPLPPVPQQSLSTWLHDFRLWLQQPGMLGVFIFTLLYKLGDASMGAMIKPFWVDQHVRPESIAFVNSTLGMLMAIVGALCGGWYINRYGVFKSLWFLGLFQAFSNLGYAAVGHWHVGAYSLYAASLLESFCQGLAAPALVSLLTHICDKTHAATQYAVLIATAGLTRSIAGALSGFAAVYMGFAGFFLLTFFLSFPAYLFLPAVHRRLQHNTGEMHA